MNPAHRHSTGPPGISPVAAGALGLTVLAAVGLEASVQAGAAIDHYQHRPPLNPLALVLELVDHNTRWPAAATPLLAAAAAAIALIATATTLIVVRSRTRRTHADRAARVMGKGRDLHPVSLKNGHERAWCPQWWRHPEALARLESLWRAWEHLRQDPALGLSVWFRDHADHHMTILLDADGPFKGCDGHHSDRPLERLPSDPPPAGMFEPEDPVAGTPTAPSSTTHRRPPPRTGGRDVSLHRSR